MTRRLALLIGNTQFDYGDAFPSLRTPANDVENLARVLRQYGHFDILGPMLEQTTGVIQEAIEDFFSQVGRDDLALLYYSGHGRRGRDGRHHLIARNSHPDRLESTSIPASFIHQVLGASRAQQRIIILDCCFSEAFLKGRKSGVAEPLLLDELQGQATAILASSGNIQYSFEEGGPNSLFTQYLITGLETGEADGNGDGLISVDELFHFAEKGVKSTRPEQVPKEFGIQASEIVIAESPKGALSKHYQLDNIRTLLNEGFTDEELRSFCYDRVEFRQVYDELSNETGKVAIVARLVEYADRRLLLDPLLAWADEQSPARFKRHQPYYDIVSTPVSPRKLPVAPLPFLSPDKRFFGVLGYSRLQKKVGQLVKRSASFYVSLAALVVALPLAAWFLYAYLSAPTLEVKQLHIEFDDNLADAPPEGAAIDMPYWVDTQGTATSVKDNNRDIWVFVCTYGGKPCKTTRINTYKTPQGEVWDTSIQIGAPDDFCTYFEVIFAVVSSDMNEELRNRSDIDVSTIEDKFLAPREKFLVNRTLNVDGTRRSCETPS